MPRQPARSRLGRLGLQVRYRVEAAIVDGLSFAAKTASPRVRCAIGTGIGTVLWALDARHRRVARDNVRLAYGETLGPGGARSLVLGSMRHIARVGVETLALRDHLNEDVFARVRVDGFEHLREAHSRGHGVIGFTGTWATGSCCR